MSIFPDPNYYDPTGGPDYRKMITVDDQVCMLEIANFGTTAGYTAMKELLLKHSDGVIIVYDVCDRESFEYVKEAWKEARLLRFEHEKTIGSGPMPILLLGNKTDREAERVVSQDEGKALARRLCAGWAECSCRNRMGVDEPFHELVRLMRQHTEKEEREKEEKRKLEVPSAEYPKYWNSQEGKWGRWKQKAAWQLVGSHSSMSTDTNWDAGQPQISRSVSEALCSLHKGRTVIWFTAEDTSKLPATANLDAEIIWYEQVQSLWHD
jgi:GTPase KRas protein